MQQLIISEKEAGQRLDKFLHKYLPLAPTSFFYKMLRKKNITLNGKKAEGKEKLLSGDAISLFLSDETIASFKQAVDVKEYETAYAKLKGIEVLYEDTGDIETLMISTTTRLDLENGIISKESPFGKAVLGHKVGDKIFVRVSPDYSYNVIIKKITKGQDDESIPLNGY